MDFYGRQQKLHVGDGESNKNSDFIGVGQSPYKISTGSGGPQKNDITNVFLHTRTVSNNLWLFFGAETRSTNGSSSLDFEYNQAGVTTTGGRMTGLGPLNGRTINDILLVINYTGGGSKPIVGVRTWLATGTWSAEVALTTGTSFMTTNTIAIDAVAPGKSFTGDGSPSNTSIAFQLVEGGLNISSLNLAGLNECSPLSFTAILFSFWYLPSFGQYGSLPNANKKIVVKYFSEVINAQKLNRLREFFSQDYIWHQMNGIDV